VPEIGNGCFEIRSAIAIAPQNDRYEAEFTSAHSVGDEENPEKKSASQSAVTPSS
jgi:hypothetical protein